MPRPGVALVAFAPLGRSPPAGVLPDLDHRDTGDTRGRHPRFMVDNFAKNRARVERIEAIAEAREMRLAGHLADYALEAAPEDAAVREGVAAIYERPAARETSRYRAPSIAQRLTLNRTAGLRHGGSQSRVTASGFASLSLLCSADLNLCSAGFIPSSTG